MGFIAKLKALFEDSSPQTTANDLYQSTRFSFSIRHPKSWKVAMKDKTTSDGWHIPIAWSGPADASGIPSLMINIKEEEILFNNERVHITKIGSDGSILTPPKNPEEYIQQIKSSIRFSGLRHESSQVSHVAGMPAAILIYSYDQSGVRAREMMVTLFGVGATYQFICVAPANSFGKYKNLFDTTISSFSVGTETAPEGVTTGGGNADPKDIKAIEQYNKGVEFYQKGVFSDAESAFWNAFIEKNAEMGIRLSAAYARSLAQRQQGKNTEIPPGIGEEAGCAYLAYVMGGQLTKDGYQTSIWNEEDTWKIKAKVGEDIYLLSFNSVMGMFMNAGWRQEGDKEIGLQEAAESTTPHKYDKYVCQHFLRVSKGSPPPMPMPTTGFPKEFPM